MKTPISYYGGKQRMLKYLLPLIPEHTTYVEAYAGGAALYWAKEPSKIEVINDIDSEIVNFWQVLRDDWEALADRLGYALHSRELLFEAKHAYESGTETCKIRRAANFWYLSWGSFGHKLNGGFGWDRLGRSQAIANAKDQITLRNIYAQRLKTTIIENKDALKLIKDFDSPNTFFYLDPPYPQTHQGHYEGFSMQDFEKLLELLKTVIGKFLLSSYPYPELSKAIEEMGWTQQIIERRNTARNTDNSSIKLESLVYNYEL